MQDSAYPFIAPSSTCMSEDLLFFDTFSHTNTDKVNFDLVQFPSPVIIDLIKIVPLGQPVEAKIPGNVRLGATNPSKCELEFFINDLTKQDAHTMTDLGKFYCNEKNPDFSPPLQIQTDGLLLRGSYRTLTLAIFGQIAAYDEKPEEENANMSAASPPAQTPASPVASERDMPYIVRSMDHELIHRQARDEEEYLDESTMKSGEMIKDNVSPIDNVHINEDDDAIMDLHQVKDQDNIEELSNSESAAPHGTFLLDDKKDVEELEYTNSSEQDNNDSRRSNKHDTTRRTNESNESIVERVELKQTTEDYTVDYDAKEWCFYPETYSPTPLVYFPDPSLTLQERSLLTKDGRRGGQNIIDKEIEKVMEMFDVLGSSDDSKTEEWVTLVEDLTNDLTNMSLSQTVGDDNMLKFLVEQVLFGLDMSLALKQRQTGFKVRHLRAGIRLATILFHCGKSAVSVLLESGVLQRVLRLYNEDQMSLPLRLLIFRCLSAACDTVEGVEHVISFHHSWTDAKVLFDRAYKNVPNQEEDSSVESKLVEEEKPMTCYQYMLLVLLSQPTTRVKIAIGNLIKKIRFYQDLSQLATNTSTLSVGVKDTEESEDSVFDHERPEDGHRINVDRLDKCLPILQDLVNLMKEGSSGMSQPVRYLPAKMQFRVKSTQSDNDIAIYKWFKHFSTIKCLNTIIGLEKCEDLDVEKLVKVQNLCLTFIKQILGSTKSSQLLLSADYCDSTANLLNILAQKAESTKGLPPMRMSGIESLPDASSYREESQFAASCQDMSLKLSYSFKVFSCIDRLFDFHRELINKRDDTTTTTSSAMVTATPHPTLSDPEKILHQLYIMSDHPYGLTAIIRYFSCIGNLDCILRFLDMPDYQKHLEFVKETSIDYVLEIIGNFLRLNNNVLEVAEEYLDTLADLCKNKSKTLSVRIKSLLPWLNPFDLDQMFPLITYSEDTLKQLTRVIRKSIPDCSIPFAQGLNFELPPQMITAVRILRQLCIPPEVESFIESIFDPFSALKMNSLNGNNVKTSSFLPFVGSLPHYQPHNQSWNLNLQMSRAKLDDSISDQLSQLNGLSKLYKPYEESICGELKYHYAVMQVYEQEGLRRLLNTLRELVGNYPRPIYQSAALSGLRGRIVISYINSVIVLLHSITCHLIDARGKEFKDTSIIPVILETYSLLCFVPKPDTDTKPKTSGVDRNGDESMDNSGPTGNLHKLLTLKADNYQLAQQTKRLILSILISYTQMCLSVSESEENVISKSMWTKMLKEVIEFTLSTPVFFHHGLDVLTKILPAPLPCSTMLDSIDQEQLFKNINHRKLWSAHLHPLHQQIELLISNLSLCYQSNIRALVYYLCNQLCDLSSNAAYMVAKIITDTLISCAAKLSLDSTGPNTNNMTSSDASLNPQDQQQQTQQQQSSSTSLPTGSSGTSTAVTATNMSRSSEDRLGSTHIALNGTKESKFAVKMVLNLLSNLITNQAFETSLTNHLQVINKKDEKLLMNLANIIRLHDESKLADQITENNAGTSGSSSASLVTGLIDSIKMIAETATNTANRENLTNVISVSDVTPPEELTKINLIDMARKTSDRFNLTTGITKTYRLKVLVDLNSRAHLRSNDTSTVASITASNIPSASSSGALSLGPSKQPPRHFDRIPAYNYHQDASSSKSSSYGSGTPRGRGGRPMSSARPDSFRSRPQNTSRPPSIHVDDFIDIYSESSGQSSSANRYSSGGTSKGNDYHHSHHHHPPSYPHSHHHNNHHHRVPPGRPYQEPSGPNDRHFYSPQGGGNGGPSLQPPPQPPSYSGRSQHGKAKYMKMK